jgi:divalent metal cation (Fe/Co/Zn/Cd) transporter
MDEAIPEEQLAAIEAVLANYRRQGLDFHALRTRQAGRQAFITLHVLVPGVDGAARPWLERIRPTSCVRCPRP